MRAISTPTWWHNPPSTGWLGQARVTTGHTRTRRRRRQAGAAPCCRRKNSSGSSSFPSRCASVPSVAMRGFSAGAGAFAACCGAGAGRSVGPKAAWFCAGPSPVNRATARRAQPRRRRARWLSALVALLFAACLASWVGSPTNRSKTRPRRSQQAARSARPAGLHYLPQRRLRRGVIRPRVGAVGVLFEAQSWGERDIRMDSRKEAGGEEAEAEHGCGTLFQQ